MRTESELIDLILKQLQLHASVSLDIFACNIEYKRALFYWVCKTCCYKMCFSGFLFVFKTVSLDEIKQCQILLYRVVVIIVPIIIVDKCHVQIYVCSNITIVVTGG